MTQDQQKSEAIHQEIFKELHKNLKKFGTYDFFDKSASSDYIGVGGNLSIPMNDLITLKNIFLQKEKEELKNLSIYGKDAKSIYERVFADVFGGALGSLYLKAKKKSKSSEEEFDKLLQEHFPDVEF